MTDTKVIHQSLKWVMHNRKHFYAEKDGYHVNVTLGGFLPMWSIVKDGVEVDMAMYHSPTKDELTAKVQAERCLQKIITSDKCISEVEKLIKKEIV